MKLDKETAFRLRNVFVSHDEYLYDRDIAMAGQEQAWIDAAVKKCKREMRQVKRSTATH